jgi:OOP family OmpA-OmpF porin
MNRNVFRQPLALVCAAVMAGAGCAGCSYGLTTVKSDCGWTQSASTGSPDAADAASNRIVLIDVTASFWPRKGAALNVTGDPRNSALNALVSDFDTSGTRVVSLGTFDGSSATVRWLLNDAALPTATGTNQAIQAEQQNARACLGRFLTRAEQTVPQVPGTDIMGALDAAGGQLGATPAARSHVLLITDGMSNTGCLNFNTVQSQGQSAADVMHACAALSGLSRLRGADVELAGVGFQALYPPLTTSEQNWLEDYWQGLCAALGVHSPGSCVVSPAGDGRASTVSRPSDPAISFPTVTDR